MSENEYYREKLATTVLDIYSDNGVEKVIHDRLKDQDAYDFWHLSLYFKEIIACRNLLQREDVSFDTIPRKEKNLFIHMLLSANRDVKKITELGSSLFEMIDGLELLNKYGSLSKEAFPYLDLAECNFVGVELSKLLADASIHLHSSYDLEIVRSVDELLAAGTSGILYDRNVTSYVFDNSMELGQFLNNFEIAYCNLFVNSEETFYTSRLGKKHVNFSLSELIDTLDRPLYHLFGERSPHSTSDVAPSGRVTEGFFLYCSSKRAEKFMDLVGSCSVVQSWFEDKDVKLKDAKVLL